MSWGPIFRRNLSQVEVNQFHSLLSLIDNIYVSSEGSNRRLNDSIGGRFLVASMFQITFNEFDSSSDIAGI